MIAIDAKAAVKIAMDYYVEISGERTKITVEEIELEEHGEGAEPFWLITLGIVDPYSICRIAPGARTDYKIFKVSAVTGEVKYMKIRKI